MTFVTQAGRKSHTRIGCSRYPRDTMLLPGFRAAGTRGATVAARAPAVKIHGEYVPTRADVLTMDSVSAHADYTEILQWLRSSKRPPKRSFVTHAKPATAGEMGHRIGTDLGWAVHVPEYGGRVQLR